MQPVDVVIFVEHVAREFDVACILRHYLRARHGIQAEVASLAIDLSSTLQKWRPRVVAVPYFYSRHDLGLRDILLRWPGVRAVNLAFEQLFSKGNQQFKIPRDGIARRHALHFAAGDYYREFLLEHGVGADSTAIVGSLSCALYRPPYRQYFSGQRSALAARHGLRVDGNWIFFPENYGAAFFSDREVERRVRMGCDRADVLAYRAASRSSLRQVMQWCRDAAANGAEIILRPRPATPNAVLKAAFEQAAGPLPSSGLHIVKENTVREWILASDVTISSFSTTLLEAAVAEKPALLVVPEPLPASMHSPWHDVAPRIATREQFLEVAANPPSFEVSHSLRQWCGQHLMACDDPLGRAADVLADVVANRVPLKPVPSAPIWDYLQSWWKRRWRDWRRSSRGCKVSRSAPIHDQYETDAFSQQDVDACTASWERVLCRQPIAASDGTPSNRRIA